MWVNIYLKKHPTKNGEFPCIFEERKNKPEIWVPTIFLVDQLHAHAIFSQIAWIIA